MGTTYIFNFLQHAIVVQLVEYNLAKVRVVGSNPIYCSKVIQYMAQTYPRITITIYYTEDSSLRKQRKFRTPLLNEGDCYSYAIKLDQMLTIVITAEGASQTDLEGKQLYDNRVGAQINDEIKQNSGYAHVINCNFCNIHNFYSYKQ